MSTSVWNIESGQSEGLLEGHTEQVCYATLNEPGTLAVTIAIGVVRAVKLWSLETMQCKADLLSTASVACCLNDRLLLASDEGPIMVWDIAASVHVALMALEGHVKDIWTIVGSDSTSLALSCSKDQTVRLWDTRTSGCVRVMEGHTDAVLDVSMDTACHTAVSSSDDTMVKLWDLGSGRCLDTYEHGPNVEWYVIMHGSGGSHLSLDDDAELNAWTIGWGRPTMTINLQSTYYYYY